MAYPISDVTRRVVYTGSAGVGPYSFSFEVLANTDIEVYKNTTLLTLTTDYSVTINANGTGSVTLVSAATGSDNITLVGARAIERTTDFVTGGDLFANTLNDEFDSLVIFAQQISEKADRGLKAPVTDPTDVNMTLPVKATRKGTVLAFNATSGNPEAGPSIASVETVANQSANINTVADSIADVNAVAADIADVSTVAGVSGNVTTVAGSIANVNTVADDLNEPVSEINTVAVNIANVNTVGNNISNVNTVAGVSSNVTTVATNIANVNTVAGNNTNVTTVAGISGNVTTVAGISANVTTVAGISGDVSTVSTNNANVTTVATNIASVNTNATNIVAIQNASTNATNAANSATAAASSASSAQAASDAALAALDSFDDRYLGQKTSDPTLDNDGNALVAGALYFNTTSDVMKVYDGSAWVAAYASLSGALLVNNNLSDVANTTSALTNLGAYPASNPSGYTSNTGTVTSVTGGSYLTGGTITTSGTLAVDATSANTASKIVARDASGNFSAGTITASLSGNATSATNLAGGGAGQVPYQSASGTTAMLAAGTSGQVLQSNGASAPSWTTLSGGFSGATINAASGSPLTLTSASGQVQVVQFTDPANSIVNLPNATTLTKGMVVFRIMNQSQCNTNIIVKDYDGNWIGVISVGYIMDLTLDDNSTAAGLWLSNRPTNLYTPLMQAENASISSALVSATTTGLYNIEAIALTDTTFLFTWYRLASGTNTSYVSACAATLSGNTFTFGTAVSVGVTANGQYNPGYVKVFMLNSTTAVISYGNWRYDTTCGAVWYAQNGSVVATVSGTTVTLGSPNSNNVPTQGGAAGGSDNRASFVGNQAIRFRISSTTFATVYHTSYGDYGFSYNGQGNLNCTITSVSGTTQTNGTAVTLAANNGNILGAVSYDTDKFIMSYYTLTSAGATTGRRKAVTCSVSGTTPTWGTINAIDSSDVSIYGTTGRTAFNSAVLSSTKVALMMSGRPQANNYWLGTFTISGSTNSYVTNSVLAGNWEPIAPKSSTVVYQYYANGLTNITVDASSNLVYTTIQPNYTLTNNSIATPLLYNYTLTQPASSASTYTLLWNGYADTGGIRFQVAKGYLPS